MLVIRGGGKPCRKTRETADLLRSIQARLAYLALGRHDRDQDIGVLVRGTVDYTTRANGLFHRYDCELASLGVETPIADLMTPFVGTTRTGVRGGQGGV